MDVSGALANGLTPRKPLGLDPAPPGFLRCTICGELAVRRSRVQVTCGRRLCSKRRDHQVARRRQEYREANRRRCAAWYEANKVRHVANVVERAKRSYNGAAGPWFVTPHAVEAWRERYDSADASYEAVLGRVIADAEQAHFVKVLESGAQLWRGPKPRRARYVVEVGDGEKPVLVTVLPPFDGHGRRC